MDAFEISEASGLVASRQNPGVLWVHNDNNYVGTLFALSTNGTMLGRYTVPFVFYGDFEDVAIGPGPIPDYQYLYLGDIGDNTATRDFIRVFRVPEPVVGTNTTGFPWYKSAPGTSELQLKYPDGAFNAEALLVDPLTGDLFIPTKLTNSCRIYRASRAQLEGGGMITLSFVREISFYKVSGGDISPDGRLILLRRGGNVRAWTRSASQTVGDALAASGSSAPVAEEINGEAIGFHHTGLGYFTLSEGYGQTNFYYRRTDSNVPKQPVVMVPPASAWRYDDSGTDRGTAWRALNYDDSAWASGVGQFGYGQGDEATVIGYGFDDFAKNPTTYFRRKFTLASVTVTNAVLRVTGNDGMAVYVNGTEVLRRNLASGAGYADLAPVSTAEWQNIWQSVAVSPSVLRAGTNVVAVEVHRADGWGTELTFDLQLMEGGVEPPVKFTEAPKLVAGRWQLKLSGPAGSMGMVEGADDMASWLPVGQVVLTNGVGTVTDPGPNGAHRFYRVRR